MRTALICLCLGVAAGQAFASGFQYYVAPLQGVTGISQSVPREGEAAPKGPKYGGMINEKYADIFFDGPAQKGLIADFNQAVRTAFPTSVIGPNQIVGGRGKGRYAFEPFEAAQCSPGFTADYRSAFAVSVGISRLSVYLNDYGDFSQALIPVTYTVRFVKLNGAAVIFSKSETIYTNIAASTREFYVPGTKDIAPVHIEALKSAILQDGRVVVNRLVADVVKNFQPKQTEVALLGKDGPYFIFDRGSEIGFKSGEEVYPQDASGKEYGFVVVHATERLAVAVASNFSKEVTAATRALAEGTRLTFSFDSPGRDDSRLSVMAAQYTPIADQPLTSDQVLANALQSILVDDLGFRAPFNLIKQDPDFVRLKTQIRGEANCDSAMFQSMPGFADNSTERRNDPDFFLKVDPFNSPVFMASGVGGATVNSIFNSAVVISLVDRSGVVRQTFLGASPYELKVTGGKGLSVGQATEVNLKNASLAALKSLVGSFNPRLKSITVAAADRGTATLSANINAVSFGQYRLVRPLRLAKLNRTIFLPIPKKGDEGVVIEAPTDNTNRLAYRGQLRAGDQLVSGASGEGSSYLRLCPPTRNGRFLQHARLRSPSDADRLLTPIVGSTLKSFELIEGSEAFLASAEVALREGFFQTESLSRAAQTAQCIVPVELQQLSKIECASGKCTGSATLASGVRIFRDAAKTGESIAGAEVDLREIQEGQLSNFVGLKAFELHLRSIENHKSKLN